MTVDGCLGFANFIRKRIFLCSRSASKNLVKEWKLCITINVTSERGTCNVCLLGRHKYILFFFNSVKFVYVLSLQTREAVRNTNTIHNVIPYASFWAPREFCEILFLILTVLFLVLILMVLVRWDVQLMASRCSPSPSTPLLSSQGRRMGSLPTTLCRRKVTLSTADSS